MISRLAALLGEKQAKQNRAISVAELAEATGISRTTIYEWRDGEIQRFNAKTIEAFCAYFQCDVGDLLTIQQGVHE